MQRVCRLNPHRFPGGEIRRQGIYTFTPGNAVLLRNNPISAPMRKPGRGGYLTATASRLFFCVLIRALSAFPAPAASLSVKYCLCSV